jgi:hypothetical protein
LSKSKINPWLRGIIDTLVGASLIRESQIPTKNRIVVILIDSAFETACRAYLKHKAKITLDKNHSRREVLMKTIKSKLPDVDTNVWDNIDYYYSEIRCDFYHQSAGKTLTDIALLDYQETVEFVIDKSFEIQIDQYVKSELQAIQKQVKPTDDTNQKNMGILLEKFNDKRDKALIAVSEINPSSFGDVKDYFKRQGETTNMKSENFQNIVARNRGTKKFFFYNKEHGRWELSGLGRFRLQQLIKEEDHE